MGYRLGVRAGSFHCLFLETVFILELKMKLNKLVQMSAAMKHQIDIEFRIAAFDSTESGTCLLWHVWKDSFRTHSCHCTASLIPSPIDILNIFFIRLSTE